MMDGSLVKGLPVLLELERHGYEAVFVGGCVRDALSGRAIKDVDIATSATPQQVVAIFPKTIPTGLQHGTVTVMLEGIGYEVTTFRTESAYEKHRRPEKVVFVTELEADLCRRDFTINAMAMRANGKIADPLHGMDDMRAGLLRCVGDADTRFQEDALRMIRAVRFAAEFELRLALGTWRAICRQRRLLPYIAMERIGAELDKMIAGRAPLRAAAWLAASGLLQQTKRRLPERLLSAAESYAGSGHAALASASLAGIMKLADKDDRWTGLCLCLSFSFEDGRALFEALAFSTARSARLTAVIRVHAAMTDALRRSEGGDSAAPSSCGSPPCGNEIVSAHEKIRRRWIEAVIKEGRPICEAWLAIARALPPFEEPADPILERSDELGDRDGDGNKVGISLSGGLTKKEWLDDLSRQLRELPVSTMKELAVRGSDVLRETGLAAGPWLGAVLDKLLFAAASGETANEREALLAVAAALSLPESTRTRKFQGQSESGQENV